MVAPRFILDTNVLSELARPRPSPRIEQRVAFYETEIATAAPVIHELLLGILRLPASRRRATLEQFLYGPILLGVPVLPYDDRAARWHASERARLVTMGRTPPFVDGQIAAIAATNQLSLITNNLSDFSDFSGLQLVDWRQ